MPEDSDYAKRECQDVVGGDKTGVARRERFALHLSTQYFAKSDITKEWASR